MDKKSLFERAVYDGAFRILISREDIAQRVQELGKEISRDYRDKKPIIIAVLNGSIIFFSDLIRHIEIDLEIDFIKISSYGDEKMSSGQVELLKDIQATLEGRHILVVEDIVDTGLSVKFLEKTLAAKNPASLRFVSLLYKKETAKVDFDIDYVGFEIPNEFVIGYGLDHKQILRNLPAIYVMD